MNKRIFKVYASRTQTFTTDVVAKNENEAMELAGCLTQEDFDLIPKKYGSDDWCIFNAFDTNKEQEE